MLGLRVGCWEIVVQRSPRRSRGPPVGQAGGSDQACALFGLQPLPEYSPSVGR